MRRGPDCSHTLKALLSPDIRRSGDKGHSKGSRTISWMEYRTLWGGVSVALILRFYPERVETKRGNGAQGTIRAIWSAERQSASKVSNIKVRLRWSCWQFAHCRFGATLTIHAAGRGNVSCAPQRPTSGRRYHPHRSY